MVSSKKLQEQAQEQAEQTKEQLSIKSKFIPGFEKRYLAFKEAPPFKNGKSWPYIKEPIELAYDNFISKVYDTTESSFYAPKNNKDIPISLPGNINAKRIVLKIIRHRLTDNSEKLTSHGQIIAHDFPGNRLTFTCSQPEKWTKPVFRSIREYSTQKNRIITYNTGVIGEKDVYDMDFTPENVDMLWSQRADKNDEYFYPNARDYQHVSLVLKDHRNGSGKAKEVLFWNGNEEEALKNFKEKSFDYLWNYDYLPKAVKEEFYMQGQDPNNPTTNNNRPSNTSNNTSAYK